MKRSILALTMALALIASPALAFTQHLYILNEGNDSVTVIDTRTGAVVGDFGVKSPPRDLDAGHRSDFVVVAGKDDLTWLRRRSGYQRIDLQLQTPGNESTAIGLSPNDQYAYLAQTDPDKVFRIELTHPETMKCLEPPDADCDLFSGAEKELEPQVRDPLHMAVCNDGAVYLVGATGDVSRYESIRTGFQRIPIPPPVPADPRGIACTPDNGVVIMSGDRVLTEVLPGASPAAVTHYPDMPLDDPGRIDVDPRRFGQSFEVLLTDRASGEILRVENGLVRERIPLKSGGPGQPLPWAVTAAANGMLGTANQGADGATILYSSWYQLPRPTGARPIDADFGPVLGAAVEADPYSLEFVYGAGGASSATSQEMVLRSSGTTDLRISGFLIYGSPAFSVLGQNCTIVPLAPGQTCVVRIGFNSPTSTPQAGAPITADLRVLHNGILTPHTNFPMKAISLKQYIAEQVEAYSQGQLRLE